MSYKFTRFYDAKSYFHLFFSIMHSSITDDHTIILVNGYINSNLISHNLKPVRNIKFVKKGSICSTYYIKVIFILFRIITISLITNKDDDTYHFHLFNDGTIFGYLLRLLKVKYYLIEDSPDKYRKHYPNISFVDFSRRKLDFRKAHGGYSRIVNNIVFSELSYHYLNELGFKNIRYLELDSYKINMVPEVKYFLIRLFLDDSIHKAFCDKNTDLILLGADITHNREVLSKNIFDWVNNSRKILIKPHPLDGFDYTIYSDRILLLNSDFPIQILSLLDGYHINKLISIGTSAHKMLEKYNTLIEITQSQSTL